MNEKKVFTYYFKELNYRLIYTFLGALLIFSTSYHYKQGIIYALLPHGLLYFITTDVTEVFLAYVEISTYVSVAYCLFTCPLQIYFFLRPGLYSYENQTISKAIVALLAIYFFLYLIVFPKALKIFWDLFTVYSQSFTAINLSFEPKLDEYLKMLLNMNILLIISAPLALLINILQNRTEKPTSVRYRGVNYMIILLTAALITPPDVLSLVIVGAPVILCYELHFFVTCIMQEYKQILLIRQPVEAD